MKSLKYQVLFVLAVVLISTCGKIEQLPATPLLSFTSFEVFDSTDILGNDIKGGRLNFYFQDGDGDLGLAIAQAGQGQDTTNLFFTLLRKSGDTYVPAADNDPLKPSDYRIPFMDRQGQNKILKGNISVTFLYLFFASSDTIKYEFYVKDRAHHESNTISTCEIVLTRNGICKN
jgi:hypothetical protein